MQSENRYIEPKEPRELNYEKSGRRVQKIQVTTGLNYIEKT